MLSEITVVIPTYSNDQGLFNLLTVLNAAKINTIVVDNHPTSSKAEFIATLKSSMINYQPQKANLGFAKGVNQGAKQACSKWLVIMNDDLVFKTTKACKLLLTKLLSFAKSHQLSATSPVLVNRVGEVENYGYRVLPFGQVQLNFEATNTNIDGLTAACLLIDREVFAQCRGFDEKFFAYLEDVDLFLRLKKDRRLFAVCTSEKVVHNHLTTSRKMHRGFKEWHDLKNWYRLSLKHPEYLHFDGRYFWERLKNLNAILKLIQ